MYFVICLFSNTLTKIYVCMKTLPWYGWNTVDMMWKTKWSINQYQIKRLKRLSTIEPRKQIWIVVFWNLMTFCTNSHGDILILIRRTLILVYRSCENRLIFICPYSTFRNVGKIGVLLFVLFYCKSYEMQSVKIHILTL